MVVTEATGEDAGGFGISDPFVHALGVAQRSEPFEQADEAFALAPVALAEGVAQVLAAGLGAVVSGGGLADGEQQVAQRRSGEWMRRLRQRRGRGGRGVRRAVLATQLVRGRRAAKPLGVCMRVPLALSLLSRGRMSVTPKPRASSSYMPLRRSPRLSMSRARR